MRNFALYIFNIYFPSSDLLYTRELQICSIYIEFLEKYKKTYTSFQKSIKKLMGDKISMIAKILGRNICRF